MVYNTKQKESRLNYAQYTILVLFALMPIRCVFITAVPITKLFAWGAGGVEDMFYERRRAEACVDWSAHHALMNAGERDIV